MQSFDEDDLDTIGSVTALLKVIVQKVLPGCKTATIVKLLDYAQDEEFCRHNCPTAKDCKSASGCPTAREVAAVARLLLMLLSSCDSSSTESKEEDIAEVWRDALKGMDLNP